MNYKDYYSILGVSKQATTDEIKSAYRKLAIKYHPDKNHGDKTANQKFIEVNEANEVLSDPEKRKKYDQFGADYKQYEQTGNQQGGFDWSKYQQHNAGGQKQKMNPQDYESMSDLFELLFGQKSGRGKQQYTSSFNGEDLRAETTISLEEAYHGSSRLIQLDDQKINIKIPSGIVDGQVLRIAGKGMNGENGGSNGDLFLTIKVAQHSEFERKGNDLYRKAPVDLYTTVLGGKALIKTMKGAVKIDIPKESPNHKVLRLRGLGMPVFNKTNESGDLFVTIDVNLPDHLTKEELDLFGKLAALRK